MKKILVVDDDDNLRILLEQSLNRYGYETSAVENGNRALDLIMSQKYNLIVTDLMMPGMKGNELMDIVREKFPDIGFIIITAYGTIEKAVEIIQKGAFDFITKPFSISQLQSRIQRYFEYKSLQQENINLKRQLSYHRSQKKLIGKSKAMQEIFYNIDIVAASDATVFIKGPSGTGKELIAQSIHDCSNRASSPFLKVNCAAIPETLFESILFGHEKGSFSGAYKTKKGVFEECDGGTLLLDEVSEIPYNMQAKLLRVLQEMKITKIGNTTEIPLDVRIIATTNREIKKLIGEGKFREDLFFRLNVFPINVLPLRERIEDIPVLIEHYLKLYQKKYHLINKIISTDALNNLIQYDWPGNVRELEHTIERAVLLSGNAEIITPKYLTFESKHEGQEQKEIDFNSSICSIKEMEKKLILAALQQTRNHRTQAAEKLGISVRTLRNKLKEYGVDN
jgi:two-component system response regulator AtoC